MYTQSRWGLNPISFCFCCRSGVGGIKRRWSGKGREDARTNISSNFLRRLFPLDEKKNKNNNNKPKRNLTPHVTTLIDFDLMLLNYTNNTPTIVVFMGTLVLQVSKLHRRLLVLSLFNPSKILGTYIKFHF